jgi:hypothetical protein
MWLIPKKRNRCGQPRPRPRLLLYAQRVDPPPGLLSHLPARAPPPLVPLLPLCRPNVLPPPPSSILHCRAIRGEPFILPHCRASQIASPRCVPPCRTTGEPPLTSHNSGASPSRSQSSPVAHSEGPVLTHGRPLELRRARFTGERQHGRWLTTCIGRSRRWRRPRPYTFLGTTVSPEKKSLSRDAA